VPIKKSLIILAIGQFYFLDMRLNVNSKCRFPAISLKNRSLHGASIGRGSMNFRRALRILGLFFLIRYYQIRIQLSIFFDNLWIDIFRCNLHTNWMPQLTKSDKLTSLKGNSEHGPENDIPWDIVR
jgi:hypothetical protein